MKLKNIKQFESFINEGTWSVPFKTENAIELAKLMESPIKAKDSHDALMSLTGDDSLFDELQDVKRVFGGDYDVRPVVASYVKGLLDSYKKDESRFKEKFTDESLKILNDIVDEHMR